MKKKSVVALGPGAPSLILIFVVLAMSMLGMLSLMNGHNDLKLSERSVQVIEAVYALNAQGEQSRAMLDEILKTCADAAADDAAYLATIRAALPDGYFLELPEEGPETPDAQAVAMIRWTESDNSRNLHCALSVYPLGSEEREHWYRHTMIAATAEDAEESDGGIEFDW